MRHSIGRRDFLKWAGAGTALVSLPGWAGCRRTGGAPELLGGAAAPGAHGTYFARFGVSEPLMQRVLAKGLSRGGDFCDLYFEHSIRHTIGMRDGEINRAFSGVDLGAGIRVLKGEAAGFAYCEDLSEKALLSAADTAAAVADSGGDARPAPLVAVDVPNYYLIRVPWSEVGIEQRLPLIEHTEQVARRRDPRIVKVSVFLIDETSHILIANSEGLLVEDERPMATGYVTCVAREGERTESASESISARQGIEFVNAENLAELATDVADMAVRALSAVEAPSGELPIVLAPAHSGILLHEAIGHGMEADFNRKGMSIYADKIGSRIACEHVTVIDDGTNPGVRGTINVDDEGNASQRTVLVERGILRSYMHDRISARHYGVAPTGSGRRQSFRFPPVPRMRNTFMLGGPHDPREIIASVRKGIYAENFANGEVKIGAGDFTFYVLHGRLIEEGRLTASIKDVNLVGSGPAVLESIDMVGGDLEMMRSGGSCGKDGQMVPVSYGMPTVRAHRITIGGRDA
ncbi:MAG: twin-arginine translocation signal domain-containing protein [Candidatus Eisenbacteria bacterium]|uniref:Twin-arginine translocation signal domain-containing protein n=1 Tax=Eiseniibacteriota bacterium TaxID=2212470 RepID=A0A938BQ47_UNCEI|nr:twin-arginine translocation signal domain-containing protein [Candidatus Eisenbacteria bacterium]